MRGPGVGRTAEKRADGTGLLSRKAYLCRSTGKQINLRKTRRPKGEDSRAVIGSRIEKMIAKGNNYCPRQEMR
jgi:hypothetical protein